MAILDDNEFFEMEGRQYLNPQVALDESNQFIDNLRTTQQNNNQKIQMDTYDLGTSVPSNLGGLTGGMGYFTSRYQTPQTNSVVADLRATAQAQALNQILANAQDMWKKRYSDAYRSYQKSANSSGSGGGNTGNTSSWQGDVTTTPTGGTGEGEGEGEGSKAETPPNPDEYYIDGDEQTKRIQERTGWMPDWLVNILKLMG